MPSALTIHEFRDDLAGHFRDINAEWIEAMFRLEPTDREVLDHPRAKIVDPGGAILFVEAPGTPAAIGPAAKPRPPDPVAGRSALTPCSKRMRIPEGLAVPWQDALRGRLVSATVGRYDA